MILGLDYGVLAQAMVLLFGLFGLSLALLAREVDLWPRGLWVALMSTSVVSAVLGLLDRAAPQLGLPDPLYRCLLVAELALGHVPSLLVLAYFLHCCGEDWQKSPILWVGCALGGALVGTEILWLYTGQITVSAGRVTHVGPWMALSLALVGGIVAVTLIALARRRKKLPVAYQVGFLLCFLTPDFLQLILAELLLVADLVRRYLEQRAKVAVLQMRPHFIHNTLMSVYYLCDKDPKKAKRVILDFTRYLQNHFTAIAQAGTIPFSEELEHTRAYLAVEQARYGDRLLVEFDTPFTFFRLPPLTLQPIVENAVQHGLDPDREPLSISVRTESGEEGVRLTVEDSGPGYSPTEAPQFALDSIRQRLGALCGGTLEVASREAGGTRVTLRIPWRE